MSARVAIIGGGSNQWVPLLVEDIANTPCLADAELVLQDIDSSKLPRMATYVEHVATIKDVPLRARTTTDQQEALAGADFVIVCISTGGLDSMAIDLDLGARHGVRMPIGDTVGPCGISRALRNVPVMLGIARDMERLCPDAWLLNVTNPMTALTRCVPAIATYTAVLIADTAIPAWHDAYRELPFVYASGAAASAGALGVLLAPAGDSGGPALRLAILGGIGEIVSGESMRRRLGPVVGEVYEHGPAGRVEWPARITTALGTLALAFNGGRRGRRRVGAALLFTGAALQRFGTYVAGHQSARDPKYVVLPQRLRSGSHARPT